MFDNIVYKKSFESFIEDCDIGHWQYNYKPNYIYSKGDYIIIELSPAEFLDDPDIWYSEDKETITEYLAEKDLILDPDDPAPVVGLIDWGVPVALTSEPTWVYAVFRRIDDIHYVGVELFASEEEAKEWIEQLEE